MIKYNNNTINDWNFGTSNLIKVYRNNAIVFYKVSGESPTPEYKVCFAVVDDITQYQETEFDDVFDNATEKWYKLNNLNQYEEYGVYASGRSVTTYKGKLTIDNGYEYEWNGSSWVNLGEISGSSRVPQGYTEVEYVQNTSTAHINTGFKPNQDTRIVTEMQTVTSTSYGRFLGAGGYDKTNAIQFDYETGANGILHVSWGTVAGWTPYSSCVGDYNKHTYDWNKNEFYRDNTLIGSVTYGNFQCTDYLAIFGNILNGTGENFLYGKMYSFQMYDNGTLIRDLVPCKRDSDNKYGAYDIVNNVFYTSTNGVNFIGGSETGSTEYPKYYSEKSDPLDDLTFNTLAEAQTYAYNNCVYDGMKATIDGDRYYFDSNDENGWVKILEYYKVEDVTPNAASGWTISGSSTYNPDSSYYDDFDLEARWTSSSYKIAKVTIYGYDHFTYYLRTSGYSTYSYVMATNVDEVSTPPSTMLYNSSSAITHTYNWNKSPKSAVNLSNYRRVTYNNLDRTVEHTFYVVFYGRAYRTNVGNATILIPKEQTNENWEQVTFSASSNVASTNKNLYIDGNNSTSGGTNHWYYRWIVGLPSGSHSSYTNYSDYNYCPNASSSTFTSVAGEQRQVNFTYDNTTNKILSFRLTDGSYVLTPSDTVYYNMISYNSCNVSSSISTSFPRPKEVKVGGSFYFSNSYDRHYIYGYQPPTLGTRYYVDNYQNTFDIVYTKLSEEAVTITYTTYDPNDSETPAFETDITYPYSGGTTSSTTLTSFDVPYTYPYTVKQTNDKFSADSQSFTAGQTSRTINFTLYPNNREFATVADLEAYQYAWEGMTAYVGDTKYKYENDEWVENKHSLPDVPFVLNYNAKQYNASTHTIPYTEGALNAINAVITGTTANIIDHHENGYIQLTGSTSTTIRALVGTTNFSRSNSNPNLTIVCKAYTPGSTTEGNILSNRKESYNWMYRHTSSALRFHGNSLQGSIAVSNTEPNTCSVRIDSSRLLKYNNWTQNTTSTVSNFSYGSDSNGGALFSGYYSSSGEYWKGVFYWIYMSLNTLTDEQVQQVIDYNENL